MWDGGLKGRCMEVKGQTQVWSTRRQNSSTFAPLGDFPISTSHLLSRSWACSFVGQFAYLHGFWEITRGCLCWGGKGLHRWTISPGGNTNRKHRTLANELVPSLLQKEGWQDQPYTVTVCIAPSACLSVLRAHVTSNERVRALNWSGTAKPTQHTCHLDPPRLSYKASIIFVL